MDKDITLKLIVAVIGVVLPLLISFVCNKVIDRLFKKHDEIRGKSLHMNILHRVLQVFVWIVAISTIGSQINGFGAAVNTLLASSGIAALGVQLAAQESLANIIDGIILQIFKPFDIGDRITLPEKGLTGNVTEMNLRHTVITTYNNTKYIISNKNISSAIIENSSRNNDVAYPIDVSITYDSDLDKAIELLAKVVSDSEYFIDKRTDEEIQQGKPPVTVIVTGFGDYGINLRATMVQKDIGTSFTACSEARKEIKRVFDENGIGFPFQIITIDNLKDLKS